MPDHSPCSYCACGYYSRHFQACGLIPEHREILCPFADSRPNLLTEGGDDDGQQLHQDGMP